MLPYRLKKGETQAYEGCIRTKDRVVKPGGFPPPSKTRHHSIIPKRQRHTNQTPAIHLPHTEVREGRRAKAGTLGPPKPKGKTPMERTSPQRQKGQSTSKGRMHRQSGRINRQRLPNRASTRRIPSGHRFRYSQGPSWFRRGKNAARPSGISLGVYHVPPCFSPKASTR